MEIEVGARRRQTPSGFLCSPSGASRHYLVMILCSNDFSAKLRSEIRNYTVFAVGRDYRKGGIATHRIHRNIDWS